MSKPRIILVEPAGALNVGSVARVMKNMQLEDLVLVNPQCDRASDEARKMAVRGIDVLERARIVKNLPEALQGCQKAIATTARSRSIPTLLEPPRVALPWLLTEKVNSALIFGPEERGLSNTELNYAQRFVCIPSNPAYPSLNLAQAVAICVYELYQANEYQNIDIPKSYVSLSGERQLPQSQQELRGLQASEINSDDNPLSSEVFSESDTLRLSDSDVTVSKEEDPDSVYLSKNFKDRASFDTLEQYYEHLETVLLKIGYLYPHTTTARMEKFRRLYNRANLSNREVAMLRGILRQISWAIGSNE